MTLYEDSMVRENLITQGIPQKSRRVNDTRTTRKVLYGLRKSPGKEKYLPKAKSVWTSSEEEGEPGRGGQQGGY